MLVRLDTAEATARRTRFVLDVLLFEVLRRKHVRRVEDGFLPKRADACFGARDFVLPHALRFAIARRGLRHAPPLRAIGAVDERNSLQQALPLLGRHTLEHRAIRRDRLEQRDRVAKAIDVPVEDIAPEYPEADLTPIVCSSACRPASGSTTPHAEQRERLRPQRLEADALEENARGE